MKRIVAVILISLLVAPLALADQKPGEPITWEKAQQLKAGTEVWLTVKDGPTTKVKVLFADDSLLVTLKPGTAKLPDRVERTVLMTGSHWPNILYRGGSSITDQVRVSKDGVFDGDRKLADLMQTSREDVLAISEPPRQSQWGWIILGVVGAVIAGVFIYLGAIGVE